MFLNHDCSAYEQGPSQQENYIVGNCDLTGIYISLVLCFFICFFVIFALWFYALLRTIFVTWILYFLFLLAIDPEAFIYTSKYCSEGFSTQVFYQSTIE